MFAISVRAHQANYGNLVPAHRRADFDARYSLMEENQAQYVTRYKERLQEGTWTMLVAEAGGKVVGYTLAHQEAPQLVHKRGLFVDPDYQGYGIGKDLFQTSINSIEEGLIDLQVIEANTKARHIYESMGFESQGYAENDFFGAPKLLMTYHKTLTLY